MGDTISVLASVIFFALTCALYVVVIVWAVGDAQRRGKSGLLVALLILVMGPIGLVAWLLFRPEPRN
jgi:hypothetical protein